MCGKSGYFNLTLKHFAKLLKKAHLALIKHCVIITKTVRATGEYFL